MADHSPAPSGNRNGRWIPRPPLNHARGGLDVATLGEHIYAIGGFDPNGPESNNSVNFMEARRIGGDDRWHDVVPLPTARSNAQVAELAGFIYVAGGVGAGELDVVERFDLRSQSWQPCPRLPEQRSAGAAATLNGRIYIAGGYVSHGSSEPRETAAVIVSDSDVREWTPVAPMKQSRGFLRMVAAHGYLYAIGGNHGGDTVSTMERYDPASNGWTTVAPMNQDRGVPGVVVSSHGSPSLIVVVGGSHIAGSEFSTLQSTEAYDLDTGQWRMPPAQLPQPRTSLVCALEADGAVLAIGGEVPSNGAADASRTVEALKLPAHTGSR
jgi:Kelch motif protein